MKKEIDNGIICISNNFVYECPLKLSYNYKQVMLGLFYDDFNMKTNNLLRINNLQKQIGCIKNEIEAGRFISNYGYVIFELKGGISNIFLPEFFNYFQFVKTLNEIVREKDSVFNLYNEINGFNNDVKDVSGPVLFRLIKCIYSDLCFDAENGFVGYSKERRTKAIKFMK